VIFDHPDLICGISKKPQNMSFAYGNTKDTLSNRRNFLRSLNINYESLVCANQVHGSRIFCVFSHNLGSGAKTASIHHVAAVGGAPVIFRLGPVCRIPDPAKSPAHIGPEHKFLPERNVFLLADQH